MVYSERRQLRGKGVTGERLICSDLHLRLAEGEGLEPKSLCEPRLPGRRRVLVPFPAEEREQVAVEVESRELSGAEIGHAHTTS